MVKRIVPWCIGGLLGLAMASALYAQGVLKSDMSDKGAVVKVRKLVMVAIRDNLVDLGKRLKADNIQDIAVNAGNIAALAAVLPPLYRETLEEEYPVKGSSTFFKGAPAPEFEKASERLGSAALLMKEASERDDKSGVRSGLETLQASCGACHSAFRGKY